MLRRLSGALFPQSLGVLQTQFGGLPGLLILGNNAIPGRQFKLLGRRSRQILELIQVKGFNLLPRPIGLF